MASPIQPRLIPATLEGTTFKIKLPGLEKSLNARAIGEVGKDRDFETHAKFSLLVDGKEVAGSFYRRTLQRECAVSPQLIKAAEKANDLMRVICRPLLSGDFSHIKKWSSETGRPLRFSSKDYFLDRSIYVDGEFVAFGTEECVLVNVRSRVKGAIDLENTPLVRKICPMTDSRRSKLFHLSEIMERFKTNPYVIPLAKQLSYTNSRGKEKIVFFHPRKKCDLFDIFNSDTKFSVQEQVDLVKWLFEALYSLEGAHGDLKPDNILLDRGKFWLCDLEDYRENGASSPHFGGTPCWAPPEALKGEKIVTEKLDVWPLGLMIYYVFTHPSRTDFPWQYVDPPLTREETLKAITQEAVHQHVERSKLPDPLKELICRMAVVNVEERYTLEQAAAHFRSIQDQLAHR